MVFGACSLEDCEARRDFSGKVILYNMTSNDRLDVRLPHDGVGISKCRNLRTSATHKVGLKASSFCKNNSVALARFLIPHWLIP